MTGHFSLSKRKLGFLVLASLVVVAGILLFSGQTTPAEAKANPVLPIKTAGQMSNAECLACHTNPDQILTLPSGETLSITVSPEMYANSVHGGQNLDCTSCHPSITGFPHPALKAQNRREYTFQYKDTCKTCHGDQYQQIADSVHTKLSEQGNQNAPICSDCHDPHTQKKVRDEKGVLLPEARVQIPVTCSKCHSTIYAEYAKSVHGSAVLDSNNPDTPTCTDCHGVHTISDPRTSAFRVSSVQLCAKCHTNAAIMDKYKISTQVLNTYVSDFHGTTVTLFEKRSPDAVTNKPVCYDCHGIHSISNVKDPQNGLEIKANIQKVCQRCHPDANINFPDAWLSHYIPSPDKAPLVYYVQLFYNIFIPLVIGGMFLYVVLDFIRNLINRSKKKHSGEFVATEPVPTHPQAPVPPAPAEVLPPSQPAELPPSEEPTQPVEPLQSEEPSAPAAPDQPKEG
jgi:predicted CXXCH cytochrome family protein